MGAVKGRHPPSAINPRTRNWYDPLECRLRFVAEVACSVRLLSVASQTSSGPGWPSGEGGAGSSTHPLQPFAQLFVDSSGDAMSLCTGAARLQVRLRWWELVSVACLHGAKRPRAARRSLGRQ